MKCGVVRRLRFHVAIHEGMIAVVIYIVHKIVASFCFFAFFQLLPKLNVISAQGGVR